MELWKVEPGLSLECHLFWEMNVLTGVSVYKAMEQAIRKRSMTAEHVCRVSHHSCSLTTWGRILTNGEIVKGFLLFLLGKCVFSSFCRADIVDVVVSHWGRCLCQSCNQAQCVSSLPTVDCWFCHLCKTPQGR